MKSIFALKTVSINFRIRHIYNVGSENLAIGLFLFASFLNILNTFKINFFASGKRFFDIIQTSKDVGTHVKKTVQSTVDSPLLTFGSGSVNARVILRNVVP